ncbi:MAG: hypothetical protein PVJ62_04740, partial [Deltaproteobacteria bacterium]
AEPQRTQRRIFFRLPGDGGKRKPSVPLPAGTKTITSPAGAGFNSGQTGESGGVLRHTYRNILTGNSVIASQENVFQLLNVTNGLTEMADLYGTT